MEVKIKNNNELIEADWTVEDCVMVVSPKELKFEPKDGDIVRVRGFYDFVFIYKYNLIPEAYYYVSLRLNDNKIELPDGNHIGYVSQLRPATEEEKKKFFDKLSEEGYSWDAERKELVKLKWKPKFGEDYYTPSFNEFEFEPHVYGWVEDKTDLILYGMGWVFDTKVKCQEFCDRLNKAIENIKP